MNKPLGEINEQLSTDEHSMYTLEHVNEQFPEEEGSRPVAPIPGPTVWGPANQERQG